jgi:hypothetical protein
LIIQNPGSFVEEREELAVPLQSRVASRYEWRTGAKAKRPSRREKSKKAKTPILQFISTGFASGGNGLIVPLLPA